MVRREQPHVCRHLDQVAMEQVVIVLGERGAVGLEGQLVLDGYLEPPLQPGDILLGPRELTVQVIALCDQLSDLRGE